MAPLYDLENGAPSGYMNRKKGTPSSGWMQTCARAAGLAH